MQILTEKEIEDVLVIHPELIEEGLILIDRQAQLESRRTDLTFRDKKNNLLLIELKKDIITEANVNQIKDYVKRLKKNNNLINTRAMLIGQEVPINIRERCKQEGIEWKEIKVEHIFKYLQENNEHLYNMIFIKDKLHNLAKEISKYSFQEYLNETSPFGVPYSSYQFFKPIDASPELSDDNGDNQEIADRFKELILSLGFDRFLFGGSIRVCREGDSKPRWIVKAKGAWQGYVLDYNLYSSDHPKAIPCQVYIGTIGYRGNRPIFKDEKSRFIVVDIGRERNKASTQYGFHKYLRTEKQALFPFYELKFNATSLPKEVWDEIYFILNEFGYFITDGEGSNLKKLWIGDVNLNDGLIDRQVGNLLEALFAVTVVKAHFKKDKGINFNFIEEIEYRSGQKSGNETE